MGVYIKGMEMPTNCRACHLKMNCDDCEGLECVCVPLHQQIGYIDDLLTDKRRDDCPLVPVPPHGDLIDRDATIGKIGHLADEIDKKLGYEKSAPYIMMTLYLNNADEFPTIIPADSAEEGE